MLFRRTAAGTLFVSIGAAALLAGCATAPVGPTIQVQPGRYKSLEQFAADDATCRQYAGNQVSGTVNTANNQAVAAMLIGAQDDAGLPILGANAQNGIQAEYNESYGRCMYATHNLVPGYPVPQYRTARPVVHHAAPAAATASAPTAASWVAPTTSSSSSSGSSGPAASSSGASGWVAPAKTQ